MAHIDILEQVTETAGKELVERLAIYRPMCGRWGVDVRDWHGAAHRIDSDGVPRTDDWWQGIKIIPLAVSHGRARPAAPPRAVQSTQLTRASEARRWMKGRSCSFRARGKNSLAVCNAADDLRERMNGDIGAYSSIATSNTEHCSTAASSVQSRSKTHARTCGKAYTTLEEITAPYCEAGSAARPKSGCRAGATGLHRREFLRFAGV